VSRQSAELSPPALPTSEPKGSSTEEPTERKIQMSLTLTSVASAVAAAITVTEDAVLAFTKLKDFAVQMMDTAETAYSAQSNAGATKLASVLAAVKAVAGVIGVAWSDGVEASLATFISAAKAAYNAVSNIFSSSSTTAAA
jgi:hypothetical protein